jgi:hypothetical protein
VRTHDDANITDRLVTFALGVEVDTIIRRSTRSSSSER